MNVNPYLFSAYLVIWTVIFIYLVYLHRKQKRFGSELENLSRRLGEEDS